MPDENTIRAGKICGSPLNGLCERVVVEVARVYDGCVTRIPSKTLILHLDNMTPGLLPPFTFVSTNSSGPATFENLVITPIGAGRSRIEGDVVIPLTVRYTDSLGVQGTATSSVSIHRDIILQTPAPALMAFTVETRASLASDVGSFLSPDTVSVVCCIVMLSKVIVMTDVVVPCYGRCVYPECAEGEEDACSALLSLPIFPPIE